MFVYVNVCGCVYVLGMCRGSSGIALCPVGNADSIGGGLGPAEQMVCVIGPDQLQRHWCTHTRTHRDKTETLE